MSIVDYHNFVKTLLGSKPKVKWWYFANLIVPILILSYLYLAEGGFSAVMGVESNVSIYPLKSKIDTSYPISINSREPGYIIIVHNYRSRIAIPYLNGRKTIWSSLDSLEVKANAKNIVLHENMFNLETPLLGVNLPSAFILSCDYAESIFEEGRKISPKEYMAMSKKYWSLSIWCFIASIFGLGLLLSSPNEGPAIST